jgi:HEAT repeat protein
MPNGTPAELVERLATPHHAKAAFRDLLALGEDALGAVQTGLRHPDAAVRYYCCRFLDHFLAPEAWDELVGMLDDPAAGVRAAALHSLACDRCKQGETPDSGKVLPDALRLLAEDPDGHVRAHAAGVVGAFVHEHAAALAAIEAAVAHDPSPGVRKKARWYAPGGPIFNRTRPKPQRKARVTQQA